MQLHVKPMYSNRQITQPIDFFSLKYDFYVVLDYDICIDFKNENFFRLNTLFN